MATAGIGHNAAPQTPYELIEQKIADLYEEAKLWLDGEPVTTQGQADDLNNLIILIRAAKEEADELRKAEAKPFEDAKAEIQARYNLLIGDTKAVKGKTILALDAAKQALTPWLGAQDAVKREVERKAREEAEAAQKAAQEAMAKARESTDLAAREEAERLADQAKRAEIAAKSAANDKAKAKGGAGRATTLRSYYTAKITDKREFARHVWVRHPSHMEGFLLGLAQELVTLNHDQTIPGVEIIEERKAV